MDWKEVIDNLKYLISKDCTDTQFDYADEIEIAIRVMESQEDLRSKIDKAIEEMKKLSQTGDYGYGVRDCIDRLNKYIEGENGKDY